MTTQEATLEVDMALRELKKQVDNSFTLSTKELDRLQQINDRLSRLDLPCDVKLEYLFTVNLIVSKSIINGKI